MIKIIAAIGHHRKPSRLITNEPHETIMKHVFQLNLGFLLCKPGNYDKLDSIALCRDPSTRHLDG